MNTVIKAYTLSECMEVMAEYAEAYEKLGKENVIFCEDRLTLIAEKALMHRLGGSFASSVSTFARFLKAEGRTVSKQGSVMLVGEVMTSLQRDGKLKCFKSSLGVAKNALCIYETLAQFAASEITPEMLKESAALLPEGTLKKKIEDFALIFEGYTAALLAQGMLDESRYLSLLPKRIREAGELRGKTVIFLCYTAFTAQAKEIIRAAMDTAENVIGIFCGDEKEIYTNAAFNAFQGVCAEYGSASVQDRGTPLEGEAELLRTGLFNPEKPQNRMPTEKISLFEAQDKTAETEYVAVKIKRTMAENSTLRYRDFAVLTPSVEEYSLSLKKAFDEYGIPYFIDEKKSIKQHPLSKFLLDCCRVVKENYSPAAVHALTQNYFFGDSDEYRNYLYKFANYRGGAKREIKRVQAVEEFFGVKYREPQNDDGQYTQEEQAERIRKAQEKYESASVELFNMLEDARNRLLTCTKNIKAKGYGREYCLAIRKILSDFDAEKKLEELDKKLTDVAQKGYLAQIYRALDSVLLEAEVLVGGKELTVAEFAAILEDGFDAMEISLIPLKADAVFIGDFTESRIEKVHTLFAMGMTEAVPRNAGDTSIVSDKEIKQLAQVQAQLEPTVAEVNRRARESLCLNLCTFMDKLYFSYPLSANGDEPALSEIFRYVHTLFCSTTGGNLRAKKKFDEEDFPYQCSAAVPAIRQMLIEKGEFERGEDNSMEDCSAVYLSLKKLGVFNGEEYWMSHTELAYIHRGEELFFDKGRISPTSLESYFGCPFGHFAGKGLRLKEREEAVVLATDSGDLIHRLLEEISQIARNFETEDGLRVYAYEKCKELLESSAYKMQQDTEVGSYASERMLKEAVDVAAAVYRQIVNSDFDVKDVELDIKGEFIKGKVDRVDTTDKYVRIIDYKSGNISDTPGDYYTGRKIQMQLYMSEVKGDRTPAGVFYFPAAVNFTSKDGAESRFRMLGFMNGDENALRAGDTNIQDAVKSEYFEATLKENKKLSKVMDEKEFVDFLEYGVLVAKQGCKELKEGYIAPTPYQGNCRICKYGGLCGFSTEVAEPRSEGAITPSAIAEIVRVAKEEGED